MMEHFDSEDDNVSRASTNRWSMMVFELPGSDILKTGYLKKLKVRCRKSSFNPLKKKSCAQDLYTIIDIGSVINTNLYLIKTSDLDQKNTNPFLIKTQFTEQRFLCTILVLYLCIFK